MNKGLFEIIFDDNCYVREFNEVMKYTIKQLPACEILKEKDGKMLVKTIEDKARELILWLVSTDCLNAREVVNIEEE